MSIGKWGVVFFVLALVLNEMVLRLEKNRWDTGASSTGTCTVRCGGLSTRNQSKDPPNRPKNSLQGV